MKSEGEAVIPEDRCSYKKRKSLTVYFCLSLYVLIEERPCEHTVRKWSLRARKRALTGNRISWHLDLILLASKTVRKYISVV